MKYFNNKLTVYLILILGFIAGIIIILFTQNSFGGGDSTQHFSLAHWGWKYPQLLFNHWGKPVFTILISPFAQFGINGVRVYNLLLGIGTAIIIWQIAQILKFRNNIISILLVLFTPIYFILMFSPLTEVSFSFFLALSLLLFFKKKYCFSAIVLSFLPLIRTEGIVLLPLFMAAYVFKRKFLTLPLLLTGFIVISALGYSYYDDFWWQITKMPYSGNAKDIYGSGSLFHFVNDTRGILGYPIGILFIIGLILSVLSWVQKDKFRLSENFYFLLLVPGSYIIFLSAHSYAWWQGIGNSLGLVRVMGSVTPLAALTALLGLNFITELIHGKNKIIGNIILYGILFWIFMLGIGTHKSGFHLSKNQNLIKQTANFIQENNLDKHKVYYFDPYVVYALNIDPYDNSRGFRQIPNIQNPSIGIPDSSIIIWDAHFGPNEGRVSLNTLQEQKSLKTIRIFKPEIPFTVLGGHNYEIHVFMKDYDLLDKLTSSFKHDFETSRNATDKISHSGAKSQHITSSTSYSSGLDIYFEDMFFEVSDFRVSINGYIYIENPIDQELPLVCAVHNENSSNYYETYDLRNQIINVGQWNYFEHSFLIDNLTSLNKLLKVYIWNKHKIEFYLDDLNIDVTKELKKNFIYNFESDEGGFTGLSNTGKKSSFLSSDIEYSVGPELTMSNVIDTITDFNVNVSGFIFLKDHLTEELALVCSLENDQKNLFYTSVDLKEIITKTNEWVPFSHIFKNVNAQSSDELLKIYIWNKNHQEFYLDDFEIKIDTTKIKAQKL